MTNYGGSMFWKRKTCSYEGEYWEVCRYWWGLWGKSSANKLLISMKTQYLSISPALTCMSKWSLHDLNQSEYLSVHIQLSSTMMSLVQEMYIFVRLPSQASLIW